MANTTYLNLEPLDGSTKLKNFPTPYNGNLEIIDQFARTNKSYTVTPGQGIFGNNQFIANCYSNGKVFVLDGAFRVTTDQDANATLATVANVSLQFQLHTVVIGSDNTKMSRLALSTGGVLSCEDALKSGTWYSYQLIGLLA